MHIYICILFGYFMYSGYVCGYVHFLLHLWIAPACEMCRRGARPQVFLLRHRGSGLLGRHRLKSVGLRTLSPELYIPILKCYLRVKGLEARV